MPRILTVVSSESWERKRVEKRDDDVRNRPVGYNNQQGLRGLLGQGICMSELQRKDMHDTHEARSIKVICLYTCCTATAAVTRWTLCALFTTLLYQVHRYV